MKHKLLILISLIFFFSCKNSVQKGKEVEDANVIVEEDQFPKKTNCDEYWKNRFPSDSTRADYIDRVISQTGLTENNLLFLKGLKMRIIII